MLYKITFRPISLPFWLFLFVDSIMNNIVHPSSCITTCTYVISISLICIQMLRSYRKSNEILHVNFIPKKIVLQEGLKFAIPSSNDWNTHVLRITCINYDYSEITMDYQIRWARWLLIVTGSNVCSTSPLFSKVAATKSFSKHSKFSIYVWQFSRTNFENFLQSIIIITPIMNWISRHVDAVKDSFVTVS